MSKFKFASTVFNFNSKEHGEAIVKWTIADKGAKYRWDVVVKIGGKIISWNARMSPTRTGALHLLNETLNEALKDK